MAEAGEAYLKLAPNTYTTTLKIQLMPSGYKTLEETNMTKNDQTEQARKRCFCIGHQMQLVTSDFSNTNCRTA